MSQRAMLEEVSGSISRVQCTEIFACHTPCSEKSEYSVSLGCAEFRPSTGWFDDGVSGQRISACVIESFQGRGGMHVEIASRMSSALRVAGLHLM